MKSAVTSRPAFGSNRQSLDACISMESPIIAGPEWYTATTGNERDSTSDRLFSCSHQAACTLSSVFGGTLAVDLCGGFEVEPFAEIGKATYFSARGN